MKSIDITNKEATIGVSEISSGPSEWSRRPGPENGHIAITAGPVMRHHAKGDM
jgi:hypothetical protein